MNKYIKELKKITEKIDTGEELIDFSSALCHIYNGLIVEGSLKHKDPLKKYDESMKGIVNAGRERLLERLIEREVSNGS